MWEVSWTGQNGVYQRKRFRSRAYALRLRDQLFAVGFWGAINYVPVYGAPPPPEQPFNPDDITFDLDTEF